MKRATRHPILIVAIWLAVGVIWQILALPVHAATVPVFQSLGRISDGLAVPTDFALDGDGNLFVAEPRSKTIVKFDKYNRRKATFGPLPQAVSALAISPDGSVIYGGGADAVLRIDSATGAVLGHVGGGPGEFAQIFALAADAQGYLFVADSSTMQISVYDDNGGLQFRFGSPGTGASQFGTLAALAFDDNAGELYVADNYTQGTAVEPKVKIFTLSGAYLRSLAAKTGFGTKALTSFGGMTFDDQGRGYFIDSLKNQIRVLGLPSTYLATIGQTGYAVGQLVAPEKLAYDPASSRLYVLCPDGRVELFGIDGGANPVRANARPQPPVPQSPVGGSEVASSTPVLSFANGIDADGDIVTYDIQVLKDGSVVGEIFGIAETAGTSSGTVASPLTENAGYTWRVQGFDGVDVSDWSGSETFYVNAVEEAPSVPVLSTPVAGEAIEGDGLLSWLPATDPDPFDQFDYRLEIAAAADFAAPLVDATIAGTSALLGDFAGAAALTSGQTYYWRVSAVDNHGLSSAASAAGSFVYGSTVLSIAANLPGSQVYLGGNHGYAGRYIGEAPVEVRDILPGVYAVTVERAGFEPFVTSLQVEAGQNATVYAALKPLLLPDAFTLREIALTPAPSEAAAPFLVDFDDDGHLDLVVGDQAGRVIFYPGSTTDRSALAYRAGTVLPLPLMPGAAPFVVDWNNDDFKDLLVGALDGSVRLYLNQGAAGIPQFDSGSYLLADGAPVTVTGQALPAVADLDSDGRKDLVLGDGQGQILVYLNQGSDEAPQLGAAALWTSFAESAGPCLADLDGDGARELVVASGGAIRGFVRQSDGTLVELAGIALTAEEGGKKGNGLKDLELDKRNKKDKKNKKTFTVMPRVERIFVADANGGEGKDVVFSSAGKLHLLESYSDQLSGHFLAALGAKIAAVEGQLAGDPDALQSAGAVQGALDAGDYPAAILQCEALAGIVAADPDLSFQVAELHALLFWLK